MLIWQRRQMWTAEDIERFARWFGLKPGMTVVDVGCGLGYLGQTFWPYFGKNGRYVGVDISEKLIREASQGAETWSLDGTADFSVGSAYALPIDNDAADCVMGQTLLLHLERPRDALAEMVRVARPEGMIVCIEPDNLRPVLTRSYSSLPKYDLETELLLYKVNTIANQGRIKLGRGDNGIAPKLPHLMSDLGVAEIEARVRETVSLLQPPYESERQKETIKNMRDHWLNEEAFEARVEESRQEFLAGGGDPAEFERVLEIGREQREVQLRQINDGEFFICGAYPVYIIKGRKRKSQ
jgi:SAM-dependent methyltransferase